MILTGHQPAYLPWLGYFDKIARSDVYIYVDSVQFEKKSFIHRNSIKSNNGIELLIVPVLTKGHREKTIADMEINNSQNWSRKHLNAIYLNYKKAPFFKSIYPKIEQLYKEKYNLLSDLCFNQLVFWLDELNISTKIIKSSSLDITSSKSDFVYDLCVSQNADVYLSGMFGKDYLEKEKFEKDKIKLLFQDYQYPIYPQLWGDFIPNLSILDYCMNCNDYSIFDIRGKIDEY